MANTNTNGAYTLHIRDTAPAANDVNACVCDIREVGAVFGNHAYAFCRKALALWLVDGVVSDLREVPDFNGLGDFAAGGIFDRYECRTIRRALKRLDKNDAVKMQVCLYGCSANELVARRATIDNNFAEVMLRGKHH